MGVLLMAYKIWLLSKHIISFIDWADDKTKDDFVFVFLSPFGAIAILLMLLGIQLHILKDIILKKPTNHNNYFKRGY